MKIKQAFDTYLLHVKKYRAKGTYSYYRKNFNVLEPILSKLHYKKTDQIDNLFFENLIDYFLSNTTKKNSKINSMMSCIITAFNFSNIIYPRRYKLKDDTESFTALSETELQRVFKYLNSLNLSQSNNLAWSLAICLFLDTGVRRAELIDMKFINVDWDHNVILLDHTKNGKKRYVFFNQLSYKLLRMAKEKNTKYIVWNYDKNKKIDRYSLEHFFDKLNRVVKPDRRIHPHRLRKTFATKMLRCGCPVTSISKLLGHSDIRQTMVYLQIDQVMLEKDYKEFYPYK